MQKLKVPFNDYIYGGVIMMIVIVLICVVFIRKQRLENLVKIQKHRLRREQILDADIPQIVIHDYWTDSYAFKQKSTAQSKEKKRVHFAL